MEFRDAVDRLQDDLKAIFIKKHSANPHKSNWSSSIQIPWSWVATTLAGLLGEYSTGLTDAIALGELELQWERTFFKQAKGFNTVFNTIQSMYDYQRAAALEVSVKQWELIPQANIWLVTVSDDISFKAMDMYMHPKYNDWITSSRPSLKSASPFLKNRTMRMFCAPKINSPISSQYDNKDLDRISRIARVPPTQLLMFVLTPNDAEFIRGEFTDSLASVIQPNGIWGKRSRKLHKLWLKVIHVEKTEHIAGNQNVNQDLITEDEGENTKLRRTDLFVTDMNHKHDAAVLSLYDQQTHLASMFVRGDYIGLYNPGFPSARTESQKSHSDIVFEYSEDTVLFHMSDKDARLAGVNNLDMDGSQLSSQRHSLLGSSQSSSPKRRKKGIVERDEEGYMDCLTYPNQIYIRDLEPSMLNITLLCRVTAIASNNPFTKQGSGARMDRYAMRIVDSTGKIDVTLWEQAGRKARKIQPGQYVLLTGLSTSSIEQAGSNATWFVNGSAVCGTEIYNISMMKGLLTSSSLRQITPLHKIENSGSWQANVTVVGWKLRASGGTLVMGDCYEPGGTDGYDDGIVPADIITTDAHTVCFQAVHRNHDTQRSGAVGERMCGFCKCPVPEEQVMLAFKSHSSSNSTAARDGCIQWGLDDGQDHTIAAYGCEETLLGVSAQQFKLMSYEAQVGLLDSVLGKPVLCSISTTSHECLRIDQVAPSKPTFRECVELLNVHSRAV
ncbi:hypothetical protein BJV82DRAFT_605146 [Fennellomyces sp. T-0311]|nr:hypothetical protein BJV82DRAFT_605146 [Fennellomyces sp. T-0311]